MGARLVIDANAAPFSALYQANRFAVRSNDGTWFFGVQDGVNGRLLHYTTSGMRDIPLVPQPTMRPTLYADPTGLYVIGGFDGDKQRIPIWVVDDYVPVFTNGGNDPRVAGLVNQVAALNQSIQALQAAMTALSSSNSATLDTKDRQALDRLRIWLGIV